MYVCLFAEVGLGDVGSLSGMEGGETWSQEKAAELIRYAPEIAPHDGGARNISTRFVSESSNLEDMNGIFLIF